MNLLQSAYMVKRLTDRAYFEKGLQQMVKRLQPQFDSEFKAVNA